MADKDSVSYSIDTKGKHCPEGVKDEYCLGHGIKEECDYYSALSGKCTYTGPEDHWEEWVIDPKTPVDLRGVDTAVNPKTPVRDTAADNTVGMKDARTMKGAGPGKPG
jgi:hypothetical protein